ncbi:MAG: hypothetical protein QP733_02035 [Dialister micraerophilus]|uniref:Uncharacterized protein n=1 Tax=Dialister micraerophilus UPII 345-E TaxID=910314 RepID=E4LA54_9FIRM|nr:hypothetical protein [Dialister micraerophilus]EFR42316.1 hypothetical protein HMPREF9220_0621 [Dialister micraerophilus UPII 345-E]MDK8253220.1 hypothetical protein [Dialister micraerophilus]
MTRLEELKLERDKLRETYHNILEGGQEFWTRDGRVKQANLNDIIARLDSINAEIDNLEYSSGGDYKRETNILLKYGGCD